VLNKPLPHLLRQHPPPGHKGRRILLITRPKLVVHNARQHIAQLRKAPGRASSEMASQNSRPGAPFGRHLQQVDPPFPRSEQALWKLWKARQLCIAGPLQPLAPRGSGRAFHTNHRLCTGLFEWPLEGVGKWRRYCLPLDLISKIPQFHSSDLENSPTMQIILFKQISTYFHFSCRNDGYYWLLSLSSLHFPLNRRAAFTNPKLSRTPRRNPAAAHPSQPCPHSGCAQ
jgi:hypothetical protein